MGEDAKKAIASFKPYRGGNDILWNLHELNRRDKHRLVTAVAAKNVGYNMTPSEREELCRNFLGIDPMATQLDSRSFLTRPAVMEPLRAGYVLRTLRTSEVDNEMHFLIDVAFAESEVTTLEPIVDTLRQMANEVVRIICDLSSRGLF